MAIEVRSAMAGMVVLDHVDGALESVPGEVTVGALGA